MKKYKIITIIVMLAFIFTSCSVGNISKNENTEKKPMLYTFSGENNQIELINGAILIDGKTQVLEGGKLILKKVELKDIKRVEKAIYVESPENVVKNTHCETEDVSETLSKDYVQGEIGSISGEDVLNKDFENNLFFQLKTVDNKGNEETYNVQLKVKKVNID